MKTSKNETIVIGFEGELVEVEELELKLAPESTAGFLD